MKEETYFVYLKESLGFLSGRVVKINCGGICLLHPDKIIFSRYVDPELLPGGYGTIAEFKLSEIIGWKKR